MNGAGLLLPGPPSWEAPNAAQGPCGQVEEWTQASTPALPPPQRRFSPFSLCHINSKDCVQQGLDPRDVFSQHRV